MLFTMRTASNTRPPASGTKPCSLLPGLAVKVKLFITDSHGHARKINRHMGRVQLEKRTDAATTTTTESSTNTATLYSNLNPRTHVHEPGTLWGATLLVTGTTVGAGILALPAITQVHRDE